ncbi:MAG: hypothetical protein ABSD74_06665 [Rhizomicrobium sp.]|jgi:hypothetical protein
MRRREFLVSLPSAALCASAAHGGNAIAPSLQVALHPDRVGGRVAPGLTGLSYETAVLSHPDFFAGDNAALIAYFRLLCPVGTLRIGGNTSDYGTWTPHPPATNEPDGAALAPDTGTMALPRRPVTPAAIKNLRAFLDATGWSLIYGLNLGTAAPDAVAAEARFVSDTLGTKLAAFQIGNEPNLFSRNGLRGADYGYAQFAAEWQRYATAVRAQVPGARFAGPDISGDNAWLAGFARDFGKDMRFLSAHYYAEGPPSEPGATIAALLDAANPRLTSLAGGVKRARSIAPETPFRLTETNSCYGGGKAAVSNTFASALWGAEMMCRLATAGVSGINFHGGGNGWYTPIAGTRRDGFTARPLYYGMLMLGGILGDASIAADLNGPANGIACFAFKSRAGELKVLLLNKGDKDTDVMIDAGKPMRAAKALRLSAASLDATDGVRWGGGAIGADGTWSPTPVEHLSFAASQTKLALAKASAALVVLAAL